MRPVCTIACVNELPQVRALAWSLRMHDSLARLFVLVLDDRGYDVDEAREPFSVVRPAQLDIAQFELLAAVHAKSELSMVVEPAFLRHVLDRAAGPLLHLKSDALVYAPLDGLFALARAHQLVLVPRLQAPVPRDSVRVTDQEIIELGIFDEGCVLLEPCEEIDAFLRAWSDCLEFDHLEALASAPRRFLDLAPGVIAHSKILLDPGVAISRLNLHERKITRLAGRLQANGQPLKIVHFDALDGNLGPEFDILDGPADGGPGPGRKAAPSRKAAQTALQKTLLDHNAALSALVTARAGLLEGCGAQDPSESRYGYDRLADGTLLNRRLRRLARAASRMGAFEGSPFSATGTHDLLAWLNAAPDGGLGAGVARYWFEIYCERPDLQAAFPDVSGSDTSGFIRWAGDWGATEYATPKSLMPFVIS